MKGSGIKDYLKKIEDLKKQSILDGKTELTISAKELHQEVSPDQLTVPTCCQAMYKSMLEGDAYVSMPKGHTGYGSRLSIKYYLHDLDSRERMHKDKKRGRPRKSIEEKEKKLNKHLSTEDIHSCLGTWLNEQGWDVKESDGNQIIAINGDKTWVIHVHGLRRGRKQPLHTKINHVLKEEKENAQYSVALNDSDLYRKQWNDVPKMMKERLNLSMLLADPIGNVEEVK